MTQESTSPPPRSSATLDATPNPLPYRPGLGVTTISWSTGDGSNGNVSVSRDGEPESVFAEGPVGSQTAPWILPNSIYVFRLYGEAAGGPPLATVLVRWGHPVVELILDAAILAALATPAILLACSIRRILGSNRWITRPVRRR